MLEGESLHIKELLSLTLKGDVVGLPCSWFVIGLLMYVAGIISKFE